MKTVQEMLKECVIEESLLILLAGIPKKRFVKMLEQYYSLYCAVTGAWYGDEAKDCILIDFRQSEYKDGRKVYSFYGKHPEATVSTEDEKIEWNQVISGEMRLYVPDCFVEKIDDTILCTMFLNQMFEQCAEVVQKIDNKPLFDHIKAVPREKRSGIAGYESLLEMHLHYLMDKDNIKNAVLEYKERKCVSFKWGTLLCDYDWNTGIPNYVIYDDNGSKHLNMALRCGKLPDVYRHFHHMDNDNPPDLKRLCRRLESLKSEYENIALSDYVKVINEGKRIIIDKNVCFGKLPLIFIRDNKGIQYELDNVELDELLCMDIYVLDEQITKPEQVLALMAFYLEYPIRIERVQRRYFTQSIIGMKKVLITTDTSEGGESQ